MHCRTIATLALLFTLSSAHAQPQPLKVEIKGVKVGFAPYSSADGRFFAGRFKPGAWAPVEVEVWSNKDYRPRQAVMIVETSDSDGVQNRYATPVPPLDEDKQTTLTTFVRPGNLGSDTVITLRDLDRDRTLDTANLRLFRSEVLQPGHVLYLFAGSPLPALKRAVTRREVQPENPQDEPSDDVDIYHFAQADRVERLPTRWFGYQAVDVLVLATGSGDFAQMLSNDRTGRREALVEWVRRGGRLIVSVGHNHQAVGELLAKSGLIDCKINGSVSRRFLSLAGWVGQQQQPFPHPGIEVAKLEVGKNVEVLLRERDPADDVDRPMIVQAPLGLGRVMLFAFDLDKVPGQPSFVDWRPERQTEFYRRLRDEVEPRSAREQAGPGPGPGGNMIMVGDGNSSEIASALQTGLESFDEVPVVSFGWVALFIFLYILVVGPLDYIFLKKVVKRLELTWITFPVVVVVVSTLAYFTAYALKGNDLKINKVDLVEVDLHSGRTYGHTWFTLFSPRIQNYTVGIQPAYPGWAPPPGENNLNYSAVVGWMGRPENVFGGTARSAGGGLFRRAYQYAEDAFALEGVPVQVWATKTFSASWEVPSSATPLFSASLRRVPEQAGGAKVTGSITCNLPAGVKLQDVVLLYEGKAYPIEQLDAGGKNPRLITLGGNIGQVLPTVGDWCVQNLPDPYHRVQPQYSSDRFGMAEPTDPSLGVTLKKAMFFRTFLRSGQGGGLDNASLRPLDESWRVAEKRSEEAILFARVAPKPAEDSEQVAMSPDTPTRLWLGQIPEPNKSRPALAGKTLQRTFLRVYIPVAPK